MRTIIEPFRTKVVEPIRFTTRYERERLLQVAGYNLFNLAAEDVIIDLLTDSGTSAMSSDQWAAVMKGDESYAGASSFFRFQQTVREIFGYREVIPVHQGRAAERLLFGELLKPGDLVISNTHFDTTRANIEALGAHAVDLPAAGGPKNLFGGDIDLSAVTRLLTERRKDIPLGLLTITNNSNGGQPASLTNILAYGSLLKEHGVPFFIDAARFAENAWLIRQRDPACRNRSVQSIVQETFAAADGCLMSAKKDGLANMGGFIALADGGLAERIKEPLILTEGFTTYGGLAGRDLDAVAVGLREVLSESYLRYREASAAYLAIGLRRAGVPIVEPVALHAVYLDAAAMLPHVPASQYPGQSLACELYREAGIRSCEIGSVMFGRPGDAGSEMPASRELVRLALPRRVYSQSHYDYVIEAVENIFERRKTIRGMTIVAQRPRLRHFTARFEPAGERRAAVAHAGCQVQSSETCLLPNY